MKQPRPVSVTIFGILNIAFAIMGLFGLLISFLMQTFFSKMNANNPMLKAMHDNPDYQTFMRVSTILGLVVTPFLLAAGIGLLKQCNWARLLSMGYAVYAIIAGIITPFIMYRLVLQPTMASMKGGAGDIGAIFGVVFAIIGALIGMVYPVLLIVFMTRPTVIASFLPAPVAIPPPVPSQG